MIPVNRPHIPTRARPYTSQALKSGWISSQGSFIDRFEKKFADFLGVKYATTTNSGTTALHLALLVLGIGPGDEVILPALTIGSCYFAIWYLGATAVPVDVDPQTYNLNPALVEAAVTKHTKAIMPVHLYGHPCDMDQILTIAKNHDLKIIEDAAEAHGALFKGKKAGSFGHVSCFSFYANKIVTTGEGGMLVTNNKKLYDLAVKLKNLNFNPKKRFLHDGIGYKYVMTNLQAAVGLASFEELDRSIAYKHQIAAIYQSHLSSISGVTLPFQADWARSVYWMYTILIDESRFGLSRNQLATILQNRYHIQTRDFFYPPQIAFKKLNLFQDATFPIATKLARQGLYLPSGLGTTLKEIRQVCDAIHTIHLDSRPKST